MAKLANVGRGPIEVGWLRSTSEAAAVYYPPERLTIQAHAKATQARCPATQDYRRNRFVVRAPFDLRLVVKNNRVAISFADVDGELKRRAITVEDPVRWFDPRRPIIQLSLPYAFVSDTPGVRLRTTPAFECYEARYPGVMIAGEFDIYDWPLRRINWAFEWWDVAADLVVRRGTPLFCVEFPSVASRVDLVELYATPALETLMQYTSNATGYVQFGTRALMRLFGQSRPRRIIPLGRLRGT